MHEQEMIEWGLSNTKKHCELSADTSGRQRILTPIVVGVNERRLETFEHEELEMFSRVLNYAS